MPSSTNTIYELIKKSIINASYDDRLKTGIVECIEHLYKCDPVKILTVALSDSTSHDVFSQKILETYCYEERIPFMKIDLKALKRILNILSLNKTTKSNSNEPTCVLIMKPSDFENCIEENELVKLVMQYESMDETLVVFNSNTSDTPACSPTMNQPLVNTYSFNQPYLNTS